MDTVILVRSPIFARAYEPMRDSNQETTTDRSDRSADRSETTRFERELDPEQEVTT